MEKNDEKKQEKPIASIVSIVLAVVLILGSAGWLFSNLEEAWGRVLDREAPVPTETSIPEGDAGEVDAVLYAACQEQLEEALTALGPIPTDADKEANAEYLDEAKKAYVQLVDLVYRGRFMFDDLKEANDATGGDIEEEYKTEWRSRAEKYRLDLYSSIEKLRDLGTGDQFIRIHSELFLAYSWLSRYSDQINLFFTANALDGGVSDKGLNRAEGHLETARDLLGR